MKKEKSEKKYIEPQFLYEDQELAEVYMSIEDFQYFMEELERLSDHARSVVEKLAVKKTK
ncbi:MAG TPA: hypothetical protein VFF04_00490 [Candidatus Babeliales bacterium]|nr:hypothetical protein [Candidatus Babeliales bacterium]